MPTPRTPAHQRSVMGQATGYTAAQIAPFVRSLRHYYDGNVTLIIDDDPDLQAFLKSHTIDWFVMPQVPGWRPHPVVARIVAYDAILSSLDPAGCALLTDVRDVVFQSDPLLPPPRTIEAFDEHDGGVFGDHALDRKYADALVGSELAQNLHSGAALCVGTVVGPAKALRQLCRTMLILCAVPRSGMGGAFGADQAALNLAVHLGLVEAEVRANFGRVATVGLPDKDRVSVSNGRITNPDGTVSPIVHQYDRHTHLITHVNARWQASVSLRPRRRGRNLAERARGLMESVRKRAPEIR